MAQVGRRRPAGNAAQNRQQVSGAADDQALLSRSCGGIARGEKGAAELTGFTAVLALLGLVLLIYGAVYGLWWLAGVTRSPLRAVPFTGGLPPAEHAVSRFHVRWYTITMLFLAFDMEMIFMYPWTLVISAVGASSVIEMFTFLAVLLAGVVYAWREGALRWA
jgi:NADH-quinone oxidoreductase subunit A